MLDDDRKFRHMRPGRLACRTHVLDRECNSHLWVTRSASAILHDSLGSSHLADLPSCVPQRFKVWPKNLKRRTGAIQLLVVLSIVQSRAPIEGCDGHWRCPLRFEGDIGGDGRPCERVTETRASPHEALLKTTTLVTEVASSNLQSH